MENASKALLMAAGVLMAVAVLSLGVFLYASFGGTSDQIQNAIEQGQLEQFNNQFLEYTAKDCTIYDILSVVNLANDYNYSNDFKSDEKNYYIKVTILDKNDRSIIEYANNYTANINNNNYKEDEVIDVMKNDILKGGGKYSTTEGTYWFDTYFQLVKFTCTVDYSELTGKVNQVTFREIK